MRQWLGVRRASCTVSCAQRSFLIVSAALRSCWPPAPCPGSFRSSTRFNFRGPQLHVRLPQIQHLLLRSPWRLVRVPLRRSALLPQPFLSHVLITPQPHIPGLPCDLVTLAQSAHASDDPVPNTPGQTSASLPSHCSFSMACALFYSRLPSLRSVRYPPGLFCQRSARSVP